MLFRPIISVHLRSFGFVVLLHSIVAFGNGAESELFRQFSEAKGGSRVLSDFSYAGYHRSERSFPRLQGRELNPADFGAHPNDGKSDRDGIQAAFDEAARLGGAVIRFDRGTYLLSAEEGPTKPLRLSVGNTILVGAGSGEDGTVLRMTDPLEPLDPAIMYSTPFILNIESPEQGERKLAKLSSGGDRGEFKIKLDRKTGLKKGDWVTLALSDPAAKASFFGDKEVSPLWSRVNERGIQVAERHQIESVKGKRIRFKEPLQVDVDARFDWELLSYPAIEEVGIEGIRFEGGWKESFVHHRSARDDGAWSCLKWMNVRNSWMRDVVFAHWNYALRMDNCSFNSVLRIGIEGALAHFSVHTRRGYGNLIGLVRDSTSNHHGPSVGYQSAATVFWRYDWSSDSSFDAHSSGPYATLLDACSGGWTYGRAGGPLVGMPNHMRYLTLWNFERNGGLEEVFDFWRSSPTKRDRFLEPIIVGFHGQPTQFVEENLQVLESLGEAVSPESLFEAQLGKRLGAFPEFLKEEMRLWEEPGASDS